ncbi:hypothetical protein VIBNISOn1_1090072 [Vibrio nigripulchritudo SOn1]|uniref:Carboxypeptidase regulatory-like domain-containing protein n=1 Tax=Vibrio nigripulchritudo SOn1 TaxID=1238450 RepID=A0AAV2VIN8_9VIBR|nr:hypothetical protein [Vibrio nigripulchritudo]CCO44358.1 hypothetical protein VIBNISOn1_1090072 [Vibrio nigripulchritudo SOn1]
MKQKGIIYLIYAVMISMVITACGGGGGDSSNKAVGDASAKGSLHLVMKDETNSRQFGSAPIEVSQGISRANDGEKNSFRSFSTETASRASSSELTPQGATTNAPNLDLDLDKFVISGVGPENETFSVEVAGRGGRQIQGLLSGEWLITVVAKDASGVEFARGEQNIVVRADETTAAIVEVAMEEGKGRFDLSVSWPKNIALNPIVTAALQSSDGKVVSNLEVEVEADLADSDILVATMSVPQEVDSGYYALVFTVHDGDSSGNKVHLAAGFAETVRVVKGQETTVDQVLKGVKGIGSIDLGIELNINNALPLALLNSDTYPGHFGFDSATEFTLSADVPEDDADFGNVIKTWYLNGQLVEVGSTFTVNSATSPLPTNYYGRYISGNYRVDVVGVTPTGERSGSASYEFLVTGNQARVVDEGSLTGFVKAGKHNGYLNDYTLTLTNSAGVEYQYDTTNLIDRDSGEFNLEGIPSGDYALQIAHSYYMSFLEPISIESGKVLNMGVLRLINSENTYINGADGAVVDSGPRDDRIASIEFPSDALVLEDGSKYTGRVKVSHSAINPSDSTFSETFPGGFTGYVLNDQGATEEVDIISYGIIAAEMTTTENPPRKLKLASDKQATIKMAVADPLTAPASLPLWHLNKETGKWEQEGTATLVDGFYEGKVSHFSFWNFDYSCGVPGSGGCPWIRVNFEVVDSHGKVVPYANIHLKGEGNFSYGKSVSADYLGRVTTKIPFSPTATQEKWESISYTVSAEQNLPDLDNDSVLKSRPVSMEFFLDHTEGVAGYGKPYTRKIVLDGAQPYLTVSAEVDRRIRGVENNGAAVKVRESALPGNPAKTLIKVSNSGESDLVIDSIEVLGENDIASPDWSVNRNRFYSPIHFNAYENIEVTYSGSDWAQSKAKIILKSNDSAGDFVVPLVTVDKTTRYISETITFDSMQSFDGQMGYCWIITDPYATDPYAPGAGEERACIHNSWSKRYPTFTGEKTRAYFAFDLSQIPQGSIVTSAKLVYNGWSGADAHIYLGKQNEAISLEDVNSTYGKACQKGVEECRFAVLPRKNDSNGVETQLNQFGLNALNNALYNGSILKLLAMNDDTSSYEWDSSIQLDQIKLIVEFRH